MAPTFSLSAPIIDVAATLGALSRLRTESVGRWALGRWTLAITRGQAGQRAGEEYLHVPRFPPLSRLRQGCLDAR